MAWPSIRPITCVIAATVTAATMWSGDPGAFALHGDRWPQPQTSYFVNAANQDLGGDAASAAVRAGADLWQQQSGAFRFEYGGPSTLTVATNDAISLVLFRNASSPGGGSAIATTYWWSSGSRILEADIVFWDGAFKFFAGSSGCEGRGFYIEDIAAHEFGHALGLGHSASSAATMYPSAASCDTGLRALDGDDIAGVRALYPPTPPPPTPTGLRIVGVGR